MKTKLFQRLILALMVVYSLVSYQPIWAMELECGPDILSTKGYKIEIEEDWIPYLIQARQNYIRSVESQVSFQEVPPPTRGDNLKLGNENTAVLEVIGWGDQGSLFKGRFESGEIQNVKLTYNSNLEKNLIWVRRLKARGESTKMKTPRIDESEVSPDYIKIEAIDAIPLDYFLEPFHSKKLGLPPEILSAIIYRLKKRGFEDPEEAQQEVLEIRTGDVYLVDYD